jgi:hypothetical protein
MVPCRKNSNGDGDLYRWRKMAKDISWSARILINSRVELGEVTAAGWMDIKE